MKEIKDLLLEKNIDIFGFTSVSNATPSVPKEFTPKLMLNQGQSIICYAVPIPKGILYSDSHDKLLFWRYSSMMYRTLDNVANSISLLLEEQGYISTPIIVVFPGKS